MSDPCPLTRVLYRPICGHTSCPLYAQFFDNPADDLLEAHTASWWRRAEIHAAANQKLFAIVRAAKDSALRMRPERDTEWSRYVLLKRKLSEIIAYIGRSSTSNQSRLHEAQMRGAKSCRTAPGPARVPDSKTPEQYYDNAADMEYSHFGPPLKRRKDSPKRENDPTRTQETAIAVPDSPPSRPPALVSEPAAAA
ncbi:hypothetical protein B0H14DRAFT_3663804 [Mycena olivaceomarginata]|nr:hypothetical protein B0H14DRAFT_3663804 [Mycena olivaceomarginata]